MKRILTLTLALMFILTSVAFATNTRVMSMGDVNNVVRDDANIWLYPQTLLKYGGLFTLESDDEDVFNMGANFDVKNFVLGCYFSTDDYFTNYSNSDGQSDMDHRLTLGYARMLGGNPFGFGFNYYGEGQKNEDETETNRFDWGMSRIELGAGVTLMEGKLDLSAAFGKNSWTDEGSWGGTDTGEYTTPNGNSSLKVMGRYWMDPQGKWQFIPHAGFMSHTEGLDYFGDADGTVDFTNEFKSTMFDFGFGTNYNVSDDVMTVTDFGVVIEKETYTYTDANDADNNYEDEYKYTHLPYFKLGLDAVVKPWLDFRCGVVTTWEKENYTYAWDGPSEDRTWTYADTDMYLGFGMHWGDFTLDGMLDDSELLHNGPYLITGADSDELAGRLTVTYQFD